MKSISLNAQKCYQSVIDRGNAEEYYVCAVITINDKRKISFIDVDDHSTALDTELKKCIIKSIEDSDVSKIQSVTYTQPFHLHAIRK
jgi:hypothetical protein